MKPTLKVTIGKQVERSASKHLSDAGYEEFETEFVSAADLCRDIWAKLTSKWDFKIDLDKLRREPNNAQRFWNLIYYFNEFHLPYEFILPYEDKQFERE